MRLSQYTSATLKVILFFDSFKEKDCGRARFLTS